MSSDQQFDEAVVLMKRISPNELMEGVPEDIAKIHALHQQATQGVAIGGMEALVSEQVWEEWTKIKAVSKDDAKNRYIEMVKTLEKTAPQSQAEVAESAQGAKTVSTDLFPVSSKSADAPVVSSDLFPSVSESADAKLVSSDLYPPL